MQYFLSILLFFAGCYGIPEKTPISNEETPTATTVDPERRNSVFVSADLGHAWMPIGKGLPEDVQAKRLDTLGKQLVLATDRGLYISDPLRQQWWAMDTLSMPSNYITALRAADKVVYAGVYEHGLYATYNQGKSWVSLKHNLDVQHVKSVLRVGPEIWMAADGGIYALQDGLKVWRNVFEGAQVNSLVKIGDNFFAATHKGIARSTDKGRTWDWVQKNGAVGYLMAIDNYIVATSLSNETEISDDLGITWQPVPPAVGHNSVIFDIVKSSGFLISTQPKGIFLSKDDGKKWSSIFMTRLPPPFQVMYDWKGDVPDPGTYPTEPMIDLIVVDGLLYGGTMRGC